MEGGGQPPSPTSPSPPLTESSDEELLQVILCDITEDDPVCFRLRRDVQLSRLKSKYAQVKQLDPDTLQLVQDLAHMVTVDDRNTVLGSHLPNPAVLYVL
eukprot:EG_transcript_48510